MKKSISERLSLPISISALVIAVAGCAGGAYASGLIRVGTANIKNGAVTALKLAPSIRRELTLIKSIKTSNGVSVVTVQGPSGATGAKGDTGSRGIQGPQGERGLTGPAGTDAAISLEPMVECAFQVCLENAPGPGHNGNKGGWWINEGNFGGSPIATTFTGTPVNTVSAGDVVTLNVAVEETGGSGMGEADANNLTVTYDPYDLQYLGVLNGGTCSVTASNGNTSYTGSILCAPNGPGGGIEEEVNAIQFRALHANPEAQVTATEIHYGTLGTGLSQPDYTQDVQASGIFPLRIN